MAPDEPPKVPPSPDIHTKADDTPVGPMHGPRRRASRYWAGETYGGHIIQYPDVERRPNGTVPSIRDKAARRLLRGAYKRKFSRVESALGLPRAMQAQAREIISDEYAEKSPSARSRRARRLFAQELAIHQPGWVPSQKQTRAIRTEKRRRKRAGKVDAIGALVDRMTK